MVNESNLDSKVAFIKKQLKLETKISFQKSCPTYKTSSSKNGPNSFSKNHKTPTCLVLTMTFLLMTSVISYIAPYQSSKVLATSEDQQNSSSSLEKGSNSDDSSSSSQS